MHLVQNELGNLKGQSFSFVHFAGLKCSKVYMYKNVLRIDSSSTDLMSKFLFSLFTLALSGGEIMHHGSSASVLSSSYCRFAC